MELRDRVVARFVNADLLTKDWLQGVRRGWESLLKPSIRSWSDVLRASQALTEFVDNLQEQVKFVNRAPSLVTPGLDDKRKKIEAAFRALREAISDHRSSIKHWYESANGLDLTSRIHGQQDPEAKVRADKMLELYQQDFAGTLLTTIKVKPNYSKGQYNTSRSGHITELFEKLLTLLRSEATSIEKSRKLDPEGTEETWGGSAFKEFSLGNMKVVIVDPKFHGKLVDKYVPLVHEAHQLLDQKGFSKAWRGELLIESDSPRKLTKEEQQEYKARGYDIEGFAGTYNWGTDLVRIFSAPTSHLVKTILHELGHRYWYKFMSGTQRAKFESLIKVRADQSALKNEPAKYSISVFNEWKSRINGNERWVLEFIHYFQHSPYPRAEAIKVSQGRVQKAVMAFVGIASSIALKAKRDLMNLDVPYPASLEKEWKEKFDELWRFLATWEEKANGIGDWTTVREDLVMNTKSKVYALTRALLQYARAIYDFHNSQAPKPAKIDDEGYIVNDPRKVLPVSDYGKTNISEAFAEVFAHYVLERSMTRDQVDSFKAVLKTAETNGPVLIEG